jgi:hypothetical protein
MEMQKSTISSFHSKAQRNGNPARASPNDVEEGSAPLLRNS